MKELNLRNEKKEKMKKTNLENNSSLNQLDLDFQKAMLKDAGLYCDMVHRHFPDLFPTEKKTFNNIFLHLVDIARKDNSTDIFKTARELLADKLDYVERHGKTDLDAKRMYVKAIVKRTGYKPKRI